MNNNLTTKLMEALQAAQKKAQSGGRAQIYPAELLLALVEQEGGVLASVLKKAGVEPAQMAAALQRELERKPRQTGAVAQSPGIGPELDRGRKTTRPHERRLPERGARSAGHA